ncbi:MAG: hypothetical protein HQL72_12370 [Magnetococcales bacterium]|nr:hypothetical protein [Magnetococcales bacterium]
MFSPNQNKLWMYGLSSRPQKVPPEPQVMLPQEQQKDERHYSLLNKNNIQDLWQYGIKVSKTIH